MIQYTPKYTIDDYETWLGDWELWNGVAVSMTPSPFGRHQFVSTNFAGEMRNALRAADAKAYVLSEIDWRVDQSTVVRPDVVIVEHIPDRHLETAPLLIAEVLSEATAEKDRTAKFALYAQQGVPIYVILDPESSHADIFEMSEGTYQAKQSTDEVTFVIAGRSIEISLRHVFA